ncbi:hypothetical protein LUZ63_015622 [Rhynchospora breviuscula]|uniref:F-box domain-containing protein n=1 Tax=Rhynchospora breviuscula TaxID=2022672 RepID=A0A9Q0HMC9_9POAL|nr:hypothetical protein LUZ63_015622 [Rhynchospora breviuscula]
MSKVDVEKAHPESPSEESERDWAELHPDLLMVIFRKVGMRDVLLHASKVCSSWRSTARDDPILWRRIDTLTGIQDFPDMSKLRGEERKAAEASYTRTVTEMTKIAADWGGNCVEQLLIGEYCEDDLLDYVAERARNLKSLSVIDRNIFRNIESMANALGRLNKLEELRIVRCKIPLGTIMKVIGLACPQLKRLKFIFPNFSGKSITQEGISTRLGIPNTMFQLQYLQLVFTRTTTDELMKILERCPNLEMLDLRSSTVEVKNDDIRIRSSKIHTLILPDDMLSQARDQYDDYYGDIYKINPLII